MDYIDYINNQIQRDYEIADEMQKLGIEDYEEYLNYMSDLQAYYQESRYED